MSPKQLNKKEENVLTNIKEIINAAKQQNGQWPEMGELRLSSIPEPSSFAERIGLIAGVCILGAVTVYAITAGIEELAKFLAIIGFGLVKFSSIKVQRCTPREGGNDPKDKRQSQRRT